jgi:large subunit ribosomal protein L22
MQFTAKARYIRFSPYKLRPIVDVVRGKDAQYALNWLSTHAVKRTEPITKMISSAVANAQHSAVDVQAHDLIIKDIRVDQGPILRYFKPGAMGRANIQRRRFSHMSIVLQSKNESETVKQTNKSKSKEA